jgi:hypothetical protein
MRRAAVQVLRRRVEALSKQQFENAAPLSAWMVEAEE